MHLLRFGAAFCPFVQRSWIVLEYLDFNYQYFECDPYRKPKALMEVSPRGLVPALKLTDFNPPRALAESTVINEYLEEFALLLVLVNCRLILMAIGELSNRVASVDYCLLIHVSWKYR